MLSVVNHTHIFILVVTVALLLAEFLGGSDLQLKTGCRFGVIWVRRFCQWKNEASSMLHYATS